MWAAAPRWNATHAGVTVLWGHFNVAMKSNHVVGPTGMISDVTRCSHTTNPKMLLVMLKLSLSLGD